MRSRKQITANSIDSINSIKLLCRSIAEYVAPAALLLMIILPSQAVSQDPVNPERGLAAGASYSVSDIETINTTNGNLMLSIPLAGLPKGRGDVTQSINLVYNSKLYDVSVEETLDQSQQMTLQNLLSLSDNGGWHYTINNYSLRSISRFESGVQWFDCNGPYAGKNGFSVKVVINMPDGSSQEFRPTGFDDIYDDGFYAVTPGGFNTANCSSGQTVYTTGGMTYYSVDGSYMKLVVDYNGTSDGGNWNLYMNDGSRISKTATGVRKYDRNGNYVEGYTDNFGRTISLQKDVYPNEDHITMQGVDNVQLLWKVNWKTITVSKTYDTTGASDGPIQGGTSTQTINWSFKVVDTVTLPDSFDNLQYQFEYNTENGGTGWGEVSKVTMPFGATSEYEYEAPIPFLDETDQIILRYPNQKTLGYLDEHDGGSDQKTDVWQYDINRTNATITAPNGTVTTQLHGDTGFEHKDRGLVYRTSDNHGNISERIWEHVDTPADNVVRDINAYVKTEFTTIPDYAGNPSLTKIVDYTFDPNGNRTEIREYDWVAYSSVPKDGQGNATGIPGGAVLLRKTANAFYNSATGNNSNAYWSAASPNVRNAIKSSEVRTGSNSTVSRTEFEYDNPSTTANIIKTKAWDSYKGGVNRAYSNPLTATNSIETTNTYDSYGNLTLTTDASGVSTKTTYGSVSMPGGSFSGVYPTLTESAYQLPEESTTTYSYDGYTGLVTTVTDVDNNVSTVTEYDPAGRPVTVKAAEGTSSEIQTFTSYADAARRVIVKSDLEATADRKLVQIRHFDQLGRVRLTRSIENIATEDPLNETHGIKVQHRYLSVAACTFDAGSNCSSTLVSNPYRAAYSSGATNEESMGWTLSQAQDTGRYSESESFAGAALPVPYVSSGGNTDSKGVVSTDIDADRTLVTDQAAKKRISKTNALGHLTDVWEVKPSDGETVAVTFPTDPGVTHGYKTSYTYDTLDNLKTVGQGVQARTFTYSSLSRLLTAANPESGTISYKYDNNGNLTQKTDARGVVTAYAYDNINRVLSRTYSNEPAGQAATPAVTYTYDAPSVLYSKGRLTKVQNSVSTTEYKEYDILGRVKRSKQTTDGTAYNEMEYTYNLSGALVETKYPSGRVVRNEVDNDGRLAIVQSKKTENHGYWDYANSFTYTAAGAVSSMQLGNGKWESTSFNSRLQPTQIALGTVKDGADKLDLDYEYSSTGNNDNNGNVLKQTIDVLPTPGQSNGFTAVQNYTYDELNRLKSANETGTDGWTQTFLYDRYGNKNYDEANTTTLTKACGKAPNFVMCDEHRERQNPEIDPANNRIKELQPDGDSIKDYEYDAAGNTKKDPDGREFFYDGANKQIKVKDYLGNTIGEYFYDGNGKRVKKLVPATGETTIFHYDAGRKLIAEYSTVVAPVSTAQVSYLTNDHLGSPRITTDRDGNVFSRRDFLPFGEELTAALTNERSVYGGDTVRQKFTGYERDNESGLDFAQARVHNYDHGRFTSPDPLQSSANVFTPQSFNRYSYVLNNPVNLVDPSGLCPKGQVVWVKYDNEDKKSGVFSCTNDGEGYEMYKGKAEKWVDDKGIVWIVTKSKFYSTGRKHDSEWWKDLPGGLQNTLLPPDRISADVPLPPQKPETPDQPNREASPSDPCGRTTSIRAGLYYAEIGIDIGEHAVYPTAGISPGVLPFNASITTRESSPSEIKDLEVSLTGGLIGGGSRSFRPRNAFESPAPLITPGDQRVDTSYGMVWPNAGASFTRNFRIPLPNGKPGCQK